MVEFMLCCALARAGLWAADNYPCESAELAAALMIACVFYAAACLAVACLASRPRVGPLRRLHASAESLSWELAAALRGTLGEADLADARAEFYAIARRGLREHARRGPGGRPYAP